MVENFRVAGEYVIIGKRLGLYDKFIYSRAGSGLYYGFTEIKEGFTSLYPIIDYVLDDKELLEYVSFYEKVVWDNFYGIRPMTFALLGFYSHNDDSLDKLFNNMSTIRLSTTQWYSWDCNLVSVSRDDPLLNLLFSYSRYALSLYRPGIINLKGMNVNIPIYYLNMPSFGGFIKYFGGDRRCSLNKPLLLPPNFFNYDHVTSNVFRAILERIKFDEYEIECDCGIFKNSVIERRLKFISKYYSCDEVILPLFHFSGNRLYLCFKRLYNDKIYSVADLVYEGEDFVIDQFAEYRGSKLRIYFSKWFSSDYRKGVSMKINLNFSDYILAWSCMFYEVLYGGKLIYSSPSKLGIL